MRTTEALQLKEAIAQSNTQRVAELRDHIPNFLEERFDVEWNPLTLLLNTKPTHSFDKNRLKADLDVLNILLEEGYDLTGPCSFEYHNTLRTHLHKAHLDDIRDFAGQFQNLYAPLDDTPPGRFLTILQHAMATSGSQLSTVFAIDDLHAILETERYLPWQAIGLHEIEDPAEQCAALAVLKTLQRLDLDNYPQFLLNSQATGKSYQAIWKDLAPAVLYDIETQPDIDGLRVWYDTMARHIIDVEMTLRMREIGIDDHTIADHLHKQTSITGFHHSQPVVLSLLASPINRSHPVTLEELVDTALTFQKRGGEFIHASETEHPDHPTIKKVYMPLKWQPLFNTPSTHQTDNQITTFTAIDNNHDYTELGKQVHSCLQWSNSVADSAYAGEEQVIAVTTEEPGKAPQHSYIRLGIGPHFDNEPNITINNTKITVIRHTGDYDAELPLSSAITHSLMETLTTQKIEIASNLKIINEQSVNLDNLIPKTTEDLPHIARPFMHDYLATQGIPEGQRDDHPLIPITCALGCNPTPKIARDIFDTFSDPRLYPVERDPHTKAIATIDTTHGPWINVRRSGHPLAEYNRGYTEGELTAFDRFMDQEASFTLRSGQNRRTIECSLGDFINQEIAQKFSQQYQTYIDQHGHPPDGGRSAYYQQEHGNEPLRHENEVRGIKEAHKAQREGTFVTTSRIKSQVNATLQQEQAKKLECLVKDIPQKSVIRVSSHMLEQAVHELASKHPDLFIVIPASQRVKGSGTHDLIHVRSDIPDAIEHIVDRLNNPAPLQSKGESKLTRQHAISPHA